MTTGYIVSFYANINKIGTRSYHCRFTQSRPNNQSRVAAEKIVLIGYLSRMLNTVITDTIVIIKITSLKRPFSTFSFTERQ